MKKLFYNAQFFSMDSEPAVYNAVLCENGKVKEVFSAVPSNIDCQKVDLSNAYVFPSFIDAHTHCFEGGLYHASKKKM